MRLRGKKDGVRFSRQFLWHARPDIFKPTHMDLHPHSKVRSCAMPCSARAAHLMHRGPMTFHTCVRLQWSPCGTRDWPFKSLLFQLNSARSTKFCWPTVSHFRTQCRVHHAQAKVGRKPCLSQPLLQCGIFHFGWPASPHCEKSLLCAERRHAKPVCNGRWFHLQTNSHPV